MSYKKTKKYLSKITAWALTFVLICGVIPVGFMVLADDDVVDISAIDAGDSGAGWSFNGTILTVTDSADIIVTGTSSSGKRIEVEENATARITLKDASVTVSGMEINALNLNGGADVTIILEGTNTLAATGTWGAGIFLNPYAATLTIDGAGSLTAQGDEEGIHLRNGGALNILGGTVDIEGYYCGILTNSNNAINISGGTVTAKGRYDCIAVDNSSSLNISGGTVIAEGGYEGISVNRNSTLNISGGKVTAEGEAPSSGISVENSSTMVMDGDGVVYASSIQVGSLGTQTLTKGILFDGSDGTVYGDVMLNDDLTIEPGQTLEIPIGAGLTVSSGAALTNNGTITNDGTITPANNSTVAGSGTFAGDKISGANVSALTVNSKTDNSITLNAVTLSADTGQDIEYAVNTVNLAPADDTAWQSALIFSDNINSSENTYYFFARSKANAVFYAGTDSSVEVKQTIDDDDDDEENRDAGNTQPYFPPYIPPSAPPTPPYSPPPDSSSNQDTGNQTDITQPDDTKPVISENTFEAVLVPMNSLRGMQAAETKDKEAVFSINTSSSTQLNLPLTISLPYTLKPGENPDAVRVWHMDGIGSLTDLNGTFDIASGMITFTANHQNYFVVGYDPVVLWENIFSDIPESAWYYNAAAFANHYGLMNGYGGGRFAPGDSMTRAMFVTVLWNIENKAAPEKAAAFGDVPDGAWYHDAVIWAAENGIVNGVGGGNFAPDRAISRQEMAVMLYRYAGFKDIEMPQYREMPEFIDFEQIESWAAEAARKLSGACVLSGDVGFRPGDTATRAEVAQMFCNFIRFVTGR